MKTKILITLLALVLISACSSQTSSPFEAGSATHYVSTFQQIVMSGQGEERKAAHYSEWYEGKGSVKLKDGKVFIAPQAGETPLEVTLVDVPFSFVQVDDQGREYISHGSHGYVTMIGADGTLATMHVIVGYIFWVEADLNDIFVVDFLEQNVAVRMLLAQSRL